MEMWPLNPRTDKQTDSRPDRQREQGPSDRTYIQRDIYLAKVPPRD